MSTIYDRMDVPGICTIYLYYVDPDDLKNNRLYCYWDSRAIEDVDRRIRLLVENAFGAKNDPPPCGQNLIDVAMRRVCYLVIAGKDSEVRQQHPLDIHDWDDHEDEADHTFCNAEQRSIAVDFGSRRKDVAVVVNRLRSKTVNGPLEPEKRDWFKLYCYDTRNDNFLDGRGVPHEHESGGTNLGPPVPPP